MRLIESAVFEPKFPTEVANIRGLATRGEQIKQRVGV